LPIGKTPLFVGGKGIVVEEEFGRLLAYVHPIQNETAMTFRHRDGKTSRIVVDVDSWKNSPVQVVQGANGQIIRTDKRNGAIVFPLEANVNYRVQSIPMPKPVSLVKPSKRKEKLPE